MPKHTLHARRPANTTNQFQSVFRRHHSTETALINIYDRLINKWNNLCGLQESL